MQLYWIAICIAAVIINANGHVKDLRIDVISVQSRLAAVKDVSVVLKYSNTGDETMSIYKWFLPKNGLFDPLFEVTLNGERVEYVGPLVKRRAPTADDVLQLTPGMTMQTGIQLSSVYNMTQSGNYVIQYKMQADQVLFTMDNMLKSRMASANIDEDFVLQSNPIMVFSLGQRNVLIEQAIEARTQTRFLTPTYISCSASQAQAIRTAISVAESYTNNAIQHLNSQSSATTRYNTWFGQYSYSNWYTLKSHFTKIQSVLGTKALSFDCGCADGSPGTYAYVYGLQHYKIYLCDEYWSASTTGTDSRGGTIIHEIAHFRIVADTDDHAYGHSKAKSLAKSNPTSALSNSDNLQYFAENNPTLY